MDYQKIYESIIARGKERVLIGEYTESHHIIPRCMGGSDNSDNLVDLTPEEHYVAHQLLIKICLITTYKMKKKLTSKVIQL